MKITPHASNTFNLIHKNDKEAKKNIQEKPKTIQDTLALSQTNHATHIKEANKAIGALQTLSKSLDKIDANTQHLLNNKQDSASKQAIQNTISQSTFDGKKVFDQDFKNFSKNIKFNSQAIKEQASHLNSDAEIRKFNQEIKTQKNFAKQAIAILQNDISKTLTTDNKDYTKLDSKMLKSPLFEKSHNLNALSLDKVSRLLA
ncbi:flagellar FLiS export co-chaperone [Helicobacter anatolicus]|uniref:flagellar FLiS export co-chaperone n=1 Tax=Helicobacter anatolicus TaxID=2905874 RepID=UPI001E4504D9|nr:flagellar FLiS export co-chaperone [Helicobacter anatolicus]MCE3039734.1 flagellar FLiS export co-chaperone [Helicobacter anatolicus]